MRAYSRRGDLAGPVLLIGFGTLILLVNLGRIPVSVWTALSQLWPLALVVLGLDLLIPRRSVLASIVVAGLLLGVMFAGAGLALPAMARPPSAAGGQDVAIPLNDASRAEITLTSGAGSMWVDASSPRGMLLSGTVNVPGGGQVEQSAETAGGTTTAVVKTTGTVIIPIQVGNGEVWDLGLASDPDLRLSAQLGAGELHIDGRGLNLDVVEASIGAGQVDISVPAGPSSVNLSAAVGELTVRVPQGTPVRLTASSLAGRVDVPEGYRHVNEAYLSPGFVPGNHIEIDASLVFGTISIFEQ